MNTRNKINEEDSSPVPQPCRFLINYLNKGNDYMSRQELRNVQLAEVWVAEFCFSTKLTKQPKKDGGIQWRKIVLFSVYSGLC